MHTTETTIETTTTTETGDRYLAPGWFTRQVANRLVRRLTRLGLGIRGARELRVRGRRSGEWRSVPVNPLRLDGATYLVAPRGTTEWVRNLRAAGGGELHIGRRVERFTATELADDVKVTVLREYLRRWKAEVGAFFEGVGPDASDEELRAAAPRHPVFAVEVAPEP